MSMLLAGLEHREGKGARARYRHISKVGMLLSSTVLLIALHAKDVEIWTS